VPVASFGGMTRIAIGWPRKVRTDKDTRRGPNTITKDKLKQAEVAAK
jgi:hypothetical protein